MTMSPLKINLGCGFTGHSEWINIDYGILALINKYPIIKKIVFALKLAPSDYNKTWPKNLRLINLKNSFPFENNSIDYIFSAHFIEHLKKYEAVKLLEKCYLGLKPGATIRIVVPDLDIIVKQYGLSTDPLEKVEILNNHFSGVFKQETFPPSFHQRILSLFARGHQWLYNFEYLKKVLEAAGFEENKIERRSYREGRVPNLDYLDNYPEYSLFVEATK